MRFKDVLQYFQAGALWDFLVNGAVALVSCSGFILCQYCLDFGVICANSQINTAATCCPGYRSFCTQTFNQSSTPALRPLHTNWRLGFFFFSFPFQISCWLFSVSWMWLLETHHFLISLLLFPDWDPFLYGWHVCVADAMFCQCCSLQTVWTSPTWQAVWATPPKKPALLLSSIWCSLFLL